VDETYESLNRHSTPVYLYSVLLHPNIIIPVNNSNSECIKHSLNLYGLMAYRLKALQKIPTLNKIIYSDFLKVELYLRLMVTPNNHLNEPAKKYFAYTSDPLQAGPV